MSKKKQHGLFIKVALYGEEKLSVGVKMPKKAFSPVSELFLSRMMDSDDRDFSQGVPY